MIMLKPLLSGALVSFAASRLAVRTRDDALTEQWRRTNHAGRPVTLLGGPAAVTGAMAGEAVAALGGDSATRRQAAAMALATKGAGWVGAYDDLHETTQAKGFRGHLKALRQGKVTSGLIKIAGVGTSALLASAVLAGDRERSGLSKVTDVVIDTALIAGTANLINLLDLRPGRAAKALTIAGLPLIRRGSAPIVGAALGALPSDLDEQTMLGDCGANALGAGLGVAAASGLPRGLRVLWLAGVVAANLASERVSFTEVIAANPVLRAIDEWGRTTPASPVRAPGRDDLA